MRRKDAFLRIWRGRNHLPGGDGPPVGAAEIPGRSDCAGGRGRLLSSELRAPWRLGQDSRGVVRGVRRDRGYGGRGGSPRNQVEPVRGGAWNPPPRGRTAEEAQDLPLVSRSMERAIPSFVGRVLECACF